MDLFTDMIKEAAEKLVTGDPFNPETDFSCLIDESNAIRIEEWVNEALKQGAKLITGGTRDGAFFEPTILTHTKPFMKVNSEEVFGPVITIEAFQNIEEAIEKINESKFGLQAGVYTNSIHEMNLAFEKIEAGGVIINQSPTLRFDHMPYGGIKDSGIGREGVKYAMEDMMERKILVK
jgi:acyl-CoA reductase-like NAD-dependent aldehyde dehydrogenase